MRRYSLLFIIILMTTVVSASSVIIKKYRTLLDFTGGKSKGVAILHDGVLSLAPESRQLLEQNISQVWKLAKTKDGLYAAAANPASVFQLKDNGDTLHVYKGKEAAVFALGADKKGRLWFAPSPGSTIYRHDGSAVTRVCSLEVTYVWDFLELEQEMLVATGIPGLILKLDQAGKVDTFFTSTELHIRTLSKDRNGNVYAGSADNGLIYKFGTDKKPTVLFDSPQTEIFSIIPAADGEIWAAGAKEGIQIPAPFPRQVAVSNFAIESGAGESPPAPTPSARGPQIRGPAKNKGMIYKISANGFAKPFWNDRLDRIQSIAVHKNGVLLVGTGDAGKIYRIRGAKQIDMLLEFAPSQVTHLLPADDKIYVATANLGSCYVLENQTVKSAEYFSKVIDADFHTNWGSLSWKGAGDVAFYTRSGNSADPDETWSSWGAALKNKSGSAIDAPPGRFLQWRAVLKAKSNQVPAVTAVDIGYLPVNIAPEITDINFYPFGTAFPDAVNEGLRKEAIKNRQGRNGESPRRGQNPGKMSALPGYLSVGWKANDPNKDEIVFDLFYKKTDAKHWRALVSEYRTAVYSWDSRTMPDGEYHIKIVASDKPSNVPERAHTSEKISSPFLVDNTPPVVVSAKVTKGMAPQLSFQAQDQASRIAGAYFAIDAGKWVMIYPADGVSDSRVEMYKTTLNAISNGNHTLTIKVFDENENMQYSHLEFEHQEGRR
ncbi:MAG: hypothetical protein ACE5I1_02295 [bacterium]